MKDYPPLLSLCTSTHEDWKYSQPTEDEASCSLMLHDDNIVPIFLEERFGIGVWAFRSWREPAAAAVCLRIRAVDPGVRLRAVPSSVIVLERGIGTMRLV